MHYPVVIHKDKDSDYGVTVPDLPGCFSAGTTVDDAMAMAKEAIELHLEQIIDDGEPVPKPGRIEDHKAKRTYAGGTWAVVTIDPSTLRVKAKRISITMPERVLEAADRYAVEHGETRSGLLVQAVTQYIGRGGDKALAKVRPGRPRKTKGR
jgi:predicted RNase H-like HicB family nuclease